MPSGSSYGPQVLRRGRTARHTPRCPAGARTAAGRLRQAGARRGRKRTPANTSGRQSRSWQGNLAFLKCSTQPLQPCTLA